MQALEDNDGITDRWVLTADWCDALEDKRKRALAVRFALDNPISTPVITPSRVYLEPRSTVRSN